MKNIKKIFCLYLFIGGMQLLNADLNTRLLIAITNNNQHAIQVSSLTNPVCIEDCKFFSTPSNNGDVCNNQTSEIASGKTAVYAVTASDAVIGHCHKDDDPTKFSASFEDVTYGNSSTVNFKLNKEWDSPWQITSNDKNIAITSVEASKCSDEPFSSNYPNSNTQCASITVNSWGEPNLEKKAELPEKSK